MQDLINNSCALNGVMAKLMVITSVYRILNWRFISIISNIDYGAALDEHLSGGFMAIFRSVVQCSFTYNIYIYMFDKLICQVYLSSAFCQVPKRSRIFRFAPFRIKNATFSSSPF